MLLRTSAALSVSLCIMLPSIGWTSDSPPTRPQKVLFDQPAVAATKLDQQRGGAAIQTFNVMDLEAGLKSNVAKNNVTGSNAVTNGAFANANGLSTVVQNSGNNVIIQNATILHLEMK